MSWDVSLHDRNGDLLETERHEDGGTYALGGTTDAELNVTYNYSQHFYAELDHEYGLSWLSGRRAVDTTARLAAAVQRLGTERDDDYWSATPGNAGYALSILLRWAQQHPGGLWIVT